MGQLMKYTSSTTMVPKHLILSYSNASGLILQYRDGDGQEGAGKGPEGGDRDGQEGVDKESGAGGEVKKDAGEGGNIGGNPRILMLEWTKSPCNFLLFFFIFFCNHH